MVGDPVSFGVGTSLDIGYGQAGSWDSPDNGVDLAVHMPGIGQGKTGKVSSDAYLAITVLVALGILWVLGAVVFKSARI